jgi:hypothetical protein
MAASFLNEATSRLEAVEQPQPQFAAARERDVFIQEVRVIDSARQIARVSVIERIKRFSAELQAMALEPRDRERTGNSQGPIDCPRILHCIATQVTETRERHDVTELAERAGSSAVVVREAAILVDLADTADARRAAQAGIRVIECSFGIAEVWPGIRAQRFGSVELVVGEPDCNCVVPETIHPFVA